jgi:hypothetical protein
MILPAPAAACGAQAAPRVVERHPPSDPAGRLMAFYSSALAFSPVGAPDGSVPWRVSLSLEGSLVPHLSAAQRTADFDKPEATNLAPVFPRPRVAVVVPGGVSIEGSWLPPVRTFGATANIASVAVSRTVAHIGRAEVIPRIALLAGRIRGPMTCNDDLKNAAASDLRVYYAAVCHGHESEDSFEPRHVSAEALIAWRAGPVRPYVSLGARTERTRFDIGVRFADGTRDQDQPVLEMHATRPQGSAGLAWHAAPWMRTAAEVYYAPGSLATVRVLVGVQR